MRGGDPRRTRRPGAVVLALMFGTTTAALVLTLLYHLGVPGLAVTFLLGLPALYLGWVPLREYRRATDQNLTQIADELAARLRSQWSSEAEVRGLNDPYPLPVAWTAADAPLVGDLDALRRLATSGAGWSTLARESWARGPKDLASQDGRRLADVLTAIPTGRLVVLGEPGAGKTMLMIGLVLDLLQPDRRTANPTNPIPVLVSLASWDPASQGLHAWLGSTLITEYPDLARIPPSGSAAANCFDALVEAGLILPVLDGLDEIPHSLRRVAITRINRELKPGEQIVVTCRTKQYRAAVGPKNGQGIVLRAVAIQLRTPKFEEVVSYLRRDAGPAAEGRWDFLESLSPKSPVRQALAMPLMAGLARVIYNPRPGEEFMGLRHPAELCDFTDRRSVEAHLFDAFIFAAYRTSGRWTARAYLWLGFLVFLLEKEIDGPDFAWWRLERALDFETLQVWFGLVGGLVGGVLIGLVGGLVGGWLTGLVAGIVSLFACAFAVGGTFAWTRKNLVAPSLGIRISADDLVGGLVLGIAGGVLAGLGSGLASGLAFGVVAGMASAFAFGLSGVSGEFAVAASPRTVLARDRQVALVFMLLGGLIAGLAGGLAVGLGTGFAGGSGAELGIALAGGLAVGIGLPISETAWPGYILTKGWIAYHHRLPWSLMSFLADARERGVLRQVGAVYQFRHVELQHRLVAKYVSTDPK